jgi:hypothetical protein
VFVLLLFTVPFKYSQYQLTVNFSYDSLLIGENHYKWPEVKSYKAKHSQYIEVLTIKLYSGKIIRLAGLTDGKKSKKFQRLKNRFIQIVEYHNQRGALPEIKETGFYKTIWAKIFAVAAGIVALIGVIAFIQGKLTNPVSLLMMLGLLGVMIPQIFKKGKTKANNK